MSMQRACFRRHECSVGTFRCICAFQSLFLNFLQSGILGKVILIILLVLCVFVNTHLLWPLSLACFEAPKPHVNSDNGGLGDSGSCCLSVQWKERLSCNGPPVGSVCKLLCAAAVWGLPPELHISVLFGWGQFIWRLSLLLSRWVSVFAAYAGSNEAALQRKVCLCCFVSDSKLSKFSLQGCNSLKIFVLNCMTFHEVVIIKWNVTLSVISCFLLADNCLCRL